MFFPAEKLRELVLEANELVSNSLQLGANGKGKC